MTEISEQSGEICKVKMRGDADEQRSDRPVNVRERLARRDVAARCERSVKPTWVDEHIECCLSEHPPIAAVRELPSRCLPSVGAGALLDRLPALRAVAAL